MNQARRVLTGCGLVLGAAGFFLLGLWPIDIQP